jgi:hypothetical protein
MPTIVSSFNQHFTRATASGGENGIPEEVFRLRALVKQSPENYWIVKPTAVSIVSADPQVDAVLVHGVIDSPLFGGQNHFESQYIYGDGTGSNTTFKRSWWMLGSIFVVDGDLVTGVVKGGVFSPSGDNYCILKDVPAEVFRVIFFDDGFSTTEYSAIDCSYFSLSLNFTEMSPR